MLIPVLILALETSEGDRDLAIRLQKRDPHAMADLYDRFGRVAYSVVLAVVKDAGIAEDLVQETFLRVWNRVHGFDAERGALGSWLLAVARNRAIDYVRSSGARMGRNSFELEEREHPSVFVDMEQSIFNSDQTVKIKAALTKLNENQQKVIELAYYEGLSQSEMAVRMGQPLGTVKTWVRSALKCLRDELGQVVSA